MKVIVFALLLALLFAKPDYYYYDESPNAHKCKNDWECTGMRTCSFWSWCQGDAGSAPSPKPANYLYTEVANHTCINDLECTGRRVCSDFYYFHGTAR